MHRMHMLRRHAAIGAALCTWLALAPAVAWAQETVQPFIRHASPGIGVRYRSGAWIPIKVTVVNPGPEIPDAQISLATRDWPGAPAVTLYRRRLSLPAQSLRYCSLFARLGEDKEFDVELFSGGVRLAKSPQFGAPFGADDVAFLSASSSHVSYLNLREWPIPGTNRKMQVMAAAIGDLPERWIGYRSADVVILADMAAGSFNAAQEKALRDWVYSGGILVVSTGEKAPDYAGTFIEGLLPVRIHGSRLVTSLPSLEARYGGQIELCGDLTLAESEITGGTAILHEGGMPMIVWKPMGWGRVVFLAFRTGANCIRDWDGFQKMCTEIASLRTEPFDPQANMLASESGNIMGDLAGIEAPSAGFVAGLLGLYVALVIIISSLARRAGRGEYGWAATIAVSLVLAAVAYQVGQQETGGNEISVNEISFIRTGAAGSGAESSGTARGALLSYIALSAPRQTEATVSFLDPDLFPSKRPMARRHQEISVLETSQEDLPVVPGLLINAGAMRILAIDSVVTPGEGIRAVLTLGEDGLSGTVTNRTGSLLEDCFVSFNRLRGPIGDLEAGETREFALQGSEHATPHDGYSSRRFRGEKERQREKFRHALFMRQPGSPFLMPFPIIAGWSEQPVVPLTVTGSSSDRRALVLLAHETQVSTVPGPILIPRGACTMEAAVKGTRRFLHGVQWVAGTGSAKAKVRFRLPVEGVRPEHMDIFFRAISGQMKPGLAIKDWSRSGPGAWDELDARARVSIADPAPYIKLPEGEIELMVSMTAPDTIAGSARIFPWKIEELDLEIRGEKM